MKTILFKRITPALLLEVFENNNIYFDRVERISVLRKGLESNYLSEKAELQKLKEENPNEMGIKQHIRLNRLENYMSLSEFQLENDYDYYNDKEANETYLTLFWKNMVLKIIQTENSDAIFDCRR